MIWRLLHGLLVGGLVAAVLPVAGQAPLPPEAERRPATTAGGPFEAPRQLTTAAIQAVPPDEIASYSSVLVRGVVTLSREHARQFFIEDSTGGVYCDVAQVGNLPALGSLVEVRGQVASGNYLPILRAKSVVRLGPGTLPDPQPVQARQLFEGKFDGDLVRLTGHVAEVRFQFEPVQHWLVTLLSDGHEIGLNLGLDFLDRARADQLIGAAVSVTGVAGPAADEHRRIARVYVGLGRPDWLQVISNPRDTARALSTTEPPAGAAPSNNVARLVRAQGVVTAVLTNRFYLKLAGTHLRVVPRTPLSVHAGDQLDLAGFIHWPAGRRQMDVTAILAQSAGVAPDPIVATPEDILSSDQEGTVVTITGEYFHRSRRDPGDLIVLKDGDRVVVVRRGDRPRPAVEEFKPGTRLQVTGVALWPAEFEGVASVARLQMTDPGALRVLGAPPWPLARTMTVLGIMSGALALGLIGLAIAHRRLRESNRRLEEARHALKGLNATLEARIRARTAELAVTNQQLQLEIAERKATQLQLAAREVRYRLLVEQMDAIVWEFDPPANRFTYVSPQAERLGYPLAEWLTPGFLRAHIHPDDHATPLICPPAKTDPGAEGGVQFRLRTARGDVVWLDAKVAASEDPGASPALRGLFIDITARQRAEERRDAQNGILELIAEGAPLTTTLQQLVRAVESQADGLLGSVLLLDADGQRLRHGAAPSLPAEYIAKIDGTPVGPSVGSCGTAAHRRETVVVEDIETDPLWSQARSLARRHGLRACWSTPIFDAQRQLLGTFALYYRRPGRPSAEHLRLLATATHTAAICIGHARTEEALRLSEERFQFAMRGANDGLWDWNVSTDQLYLSPRWKGMLGYADHELSNHVDTWHALVEPSDREVTLQIMQAVLQGSGATFQAEFRLRHKAGHWVTVLSRAFLVRDAAGQPARLVGTHVDVTERRQAERSLRESEERFAKAFANSPTLTTIATFPDGILMDVNEEFTRLLGYSREAVLGRTAAEAGIWVDPGQHAELMRALSEGQPIRGVEFALRARHGQLITVLGSLVQVDIGHRPCTLTIAYDITRRKRTEDAFRALTAAASVIPAEQFFPHVARSLSEIFGTRFALVAERLPGTDVRVEALALYADGQLLPSLGRRLAGSSCTEVLTQGQALVLAGAQARFPDDALVHDLPAESYCGLAVLDSRREPVGLIAILHDSPLAHTPELEPILRLFADSVGVEIERRRSLVALRAAKSRFRSAIEHSFECVVMTDDQLLCTYISPGVTRILDLGVSAVMGQSLLSLVWPDDLALVKRHYEELRQEAGARAEIEFRVRHRSGACRWIQTSDTNRLTDPNLHSIVSNFRDVTERREAEQTRIQLEAQLLQAQRIEAIGTLAGGFAHDFNNILGSIIGFSELARRDARNNVAAVENLSQVLKASHRAKELVRQILTFSRHQEFQRQPLDLAQFLADAVSLLRANLPGSIQLVTAASRPAPRVLANATLLQQVLVNLVANAVQAIGARHGKITIDVTTQPAEFVEPALPSPGPGLSDSLQACIRIQDDGPGIEPAIVDRIFEPFFTTKGPGEGTGLGLSVVHGIVRAHGGFIRVESPARHGTSARSGATFEIRLPTLAPDPATPHPPVAPPEILPGRALVKT